jgi:uncharacterized membrane protein YkvA (DUF1232 family)
MGMFSGSMIWIFVAAQAIAGASRRVRIPRAESCRQVIRPSTRRSSFVNGDEGGAFICRVPDHWVVWWSDWWTIPLGVVGGLVLVWAVLAAVLWRTKPDDYDLKEALRLLPDLIRLIKRLAADPDTPRGVRIRLALLLVYVALPIDLIPDFIPVLGYADDAIIVALVLRSATRIAGPDALAKHWPGTPEGLIALKRLCRLNDR